MKRKSLVLSLWILVASAITANGSVLDAPHNETNNMTCGSCHTYSLWWQYSPGLQNQTQGYSAITGAICLTCHDANASLPIGTTHSGADMGSTSYHSGNWDMGCTDCHNPHYQDQLNWVGINDPYLLSGTITSVTPDTPVVGQTTITYSGATTNANWPAGSWAAKNGRGLILVHDTSQTANTFGIISDNATSSTVVINGILDPAETNSGTCSYANCATGCNSLGLVYGQLIKDKVDTPFSGTKDVVFFDRNGGFVDAANYTGICQVCHTQTLHYRNDASAPGVSHAGRDNSNCVSCHDHKEGFKGAGHDASHFGWADVGTTTCNACHIDGGTGIVNSIHNGTCGTCHLDPGGGGTLIAGDAANGVDGDATGENKTTFASTCADCHNSGTKAVNTIPDAHHLASTNSYAVNGNCTQCHADEAGKLAADHSVFIQDFVYDVPNNKSCASASCHAGNVGQTTGAPVDSANNRVHDACTTCHETNGDLKAPTAIAPAMPLGGGACNVCHTDKTGAHFVDHVTSGRVVLPTSGNCSGCHDATVNTNAFVDASNNVVHDSCSTCHNTIDYTLRTDTGRALAAGDCTSCHSDIDNGTTLNLFAHDVDHATTNRVTVAANCTDCHASTVAYPAFVDAADAKKHNACTSCHVSDTDLSLRTDAGRTLVAGDCAACHFNDFATAPHKVVGHSAMVAVDTTCTGCHDATAGTGTDLPLSSTDKKVHDACVTCHTANGRLIDPATSTLVDAMPVGAGGVGGTDGGGDCQTCHTYLGNHIDHAATSRVTLPASGNCTTCHTATVASATFVDPTNNAIHDSCETCHVDTTSNNYALRTDTGRTLAAGDCTSCHSDKDDGTTLNLFAHDVDHATTNRVNLAANCTTCHASTVAYPAFVDGADAVKHDACATCHVSSTDLSLRTDTGRTLTAGDCTSCHSDKDDGTTLNLFAHDVDHAASNRVTAAANCTTCHSTTVAYPAFVDAADAVKHDACTTCHVSATDLSLRTDAGRTLASGDCTSCHSDKDDGTTLNLFAHDVDHAATNRVSVAANCTDCHSSTVAYPAFVDAADAKKHNACTSCHVSATDLSLRTDAGRTLVAGDCAACHFNDFATAPHKVVGHSAMVAVDTTCTGCHDATAGSASSLPLSSTDNKVHDNCVACHTANGRLIDPTTSTLVDAMPAGANGNGGTDGGGDCQACHTYTGSHIDHAATSRVTLPASGNCTTCHTATVVSATFVDPTNNAVHDSCDTCHTDSTNNDYTLRTDAGRTLAAGDCTSCHSDKDDGTTLDLFAHQVDHNATNRVTLAGNCASCHADTIAYPAFVDAADLTKHNACTSCHISSTDLGLRTDAGRTLLAGDCAGCHFTDFGGHPAVNHLVRVGGIDNCTGCHSGTAGTGSGIPIAAEPKVHNACTSCHTSTGALQPNAAPGLDGVADCGECHFTTFSSHLVAGHANAVAGVVACTSCHIATAGTAIAIPTSTTDNQVHDGCTSCHDANNGSLVAEAAPGNDGVANCTDCHATADANDHITNHDATAYESSPTQETNSAIIGQCAGCHDTMGFTNINSGHMGRTVATGAINGAGTVGSAISCDTCHASTVQAVIDAIAAGKIGTTVSCADCHTPRGVPHGGHPTPDTIALAASSCAVCHDNDSSNPKEVVADIHNNTCSNCHTSPPVLDDPANKPNAIAITNGGDCQTCHGSVYDHDNDIHAKIAYGDPATTGSTAGCTGCHNADPILEHTGASQTGRAWDCTVCHSNPCFDTIISDSINNGTTVYCTACHDGNKTGLIGLPWPHGKSAAEHNVKTTSNCEVCHTVTTNALDDLHMVGGNAGNCNMCHGYTVATATSAKPPVEATVSAVIAAGGGTCEDCHGTNHGADHNNLTLPSAAGCNSCHAQGATFDEVVAVHWNGCVRCHTSTDTTVTGAINTGSNNGAYNGSGSAVSCEDCHGNGHHDSPNAQAGDCTFCHADPRPDWETTYSVNGTQAKQLACQSCHVEQSGNDLVVYRLSYTPVALNSSPGISFNVDSRGVATVQNLGAVHTIAATGGSRIDVYNYGACLGCHDGSDPQAPAISIYHAKPVKLSHNQNSWTTSPFDTLRYAPGRDKFYKFRADLRDPEDFMKGGSAENRGKDVFKDYRSAGWPTPNPNIQDSNVTIPCFSLVNSRGKCNNGSNVTVPVFNDIPAPNVGSANDSVFVAKATWNEAGSSLLRVVAYNGFDNDAGTSLTLSYSTVNNAPMTYNATLGGWEYTSTAISYTAANVTVTSNASGSPSDVRLVDDMTAGGGSGLPSEPAQLHFDNAVNLPASSTNYGTCDSCHSGNLAVEHYNQGIGCTACHGSGCVDPLVTAAVAAGSPSQGGTPSAVDCFSCHYQSSSQPANHPEDIMPAHDIMMRGTDLSNNEACDTCHRVGGTTSTNPLFTNSWLGTDGILEMHTNTNGCDTCHASTRTTDTTGAGIQDMIATGGTLGCLDCHTDRINGHGDHEATDFVRSPNCTTTCHPGNNIANDIHVAAKGDCSSCHVNAAGAGTLRSFAIGQTRASSCEDCHGTGTSTAHHGGAYAQIGDCTFCHADPRPDWETTYSVTGTKAKQLACQTCHVESTGNDMVVYRLSYTPVALSSSPGTNFNVDGNGVATVQNLGAVHTITATQGSRIDVYNYGACLGCHDGSDPQAAAISIYHAKPVKLAHSRNSYTTSPFDTLRYAPGRDTFYKFRADFRDPKDFMKGGSAENRGKNVFKDYEANGWPTPNPNIQDSDATIPCFSLVNSRGKCNNGSNVTVPVFNDIPAPVPPVANAVNDSLSADPDATTQLAVLSNDSGPGISIQSFTQPDNANCSTALGSDIAITCGNGWTGTTTFSYTIVDSDSQTSNATVSVNVNNVAPFTDWNDNLNSMGSGITTNINNHWYPQNNTHGVNGWTIGTSTPSGGTGPQSTLDGNFLFLETSSNPGVLPGSENYVESAVLDASSYVITVQFDWNMNVENNNDAVFYLDVWNGSTWVSETTIQTGNAGDVWNSFGPYNLSAYTNADMKVRIGYHVGANGATSGSYSYRNDIAIDNLVVNGTP